MASSRGPRPASVEDFNDLINETVPETRKVADARARRRSGLTSGVFATGGDLASDSGYSSHAAATVASSDSTGLSYTNQSPTRARYSMTAPTPKRRPSMAASQRPPDVRPELPRLKTSSSNRSRSSTRGSQHSQCDCKNCLGQHRSRTTPTPLDSPWDINYHPFNQQPDRKPAPRPSRKYSTEAPAVVQPARSRPQPMRDARPVSYAGPGSYTEEEYLTAFYDVAPGPPLAMSAYTNVPMPVSRRSSMAAYPPSPFVPSPTGLPEMYDAYPVPTSRPQPSRRASDHYAARPASMYGEPVIDYDYPPVSMPNHRASMIEPYDALPFTQEEEDFYRMPPPTMPVRRPSMRTSNSAKPRRESLRSIPSDTGATIMTNKMERVRTVPSQEASNLRRPPLSGRSSGRRLKSYHDGLAKVEVEDESRRRASYYGHEKAKDLERTAQKYQEEVAKTTATPLTAEALRATRKAPRRHHRLGSSHSTSSRESSEVKSTRSRTGSGVAISVPDSSAESGVADSFTMRFNHGSAVKFDFEGRTIFVRSGGQNGEQAEVSIGSTNSSAPASRKGGYVDSRGLEYTRSGGRLRREIEEERRSRADAGGGGSGRGSSTTRSRRSSKAPPTGRYPAEY